MKTHNCPTCGTECKVVGIGDFNDKDEVCTQHYEPVVLDVDDLVKIIEKTKWEYGANVFHNVNTESLTNELARNIHKAMRGEK